VCLALPSCAIPFGQRYVKIKLAQKEKIIQSTAALWHAYEKVERVFSLASPLKTFPIAGGSGDVGTLSSIFWDGTALAANISTAAAGTAPSLGVIP
jgi:hypothetical protein